MTGKGNKSRDLAYSRHYRSFLRCSWLQSTRFLQTSFCPVLRYSLLSVGTPGRAPGTGFMASHATFIMPAHGKQIQGGYRFLKIKCLKIISLLREVTFSQGMMWSLINAGDPVSPTEGRGTCRLYKNANIKKRSRCFKFLWRHVQTLWLQFLSAYSLGSSLRQSRAQSQLAFRYLLLLPSVLNCESGAA